MLTLTEVAIVSTLFNQFLAWFGGWEKLGFWFPENICLCCALVGLKFVSCHDRGRFNDAYRNLNKLFRFVKNIGAKMLNVTADFNPSHEKSLIKLRWPLYNIA